MRYRYNRCALGEGQRVNDLFERGEGRLTYWVLADDKATDEA
jgi:hypothetical protein